MVLKLERVAVKSVMTKLQDEARVLAEVCDSLYQTAAVNVQNSNAQEFAKTMRSGPKTSRSLAEYYETITQTAPLNFMK